MATIGRADASEIVQVIENQPVFLLLLGGVVQHPLAVYPTLFCLQVVRGRLGEASLPSNLDSSGWRQFACGESIHP
jgi:hypothetical protein